jgi:two-component system, chemotaxis family, protein-glutamate methylesterase/glutaminase
MDVHAQDSPPRSLAAPVIEAQIKVLIVDDSAVARGVIAKLLRQNPAISVVGFCQNGTEIASAIETLKPDVITLDVEMPLLKGPTILRHLLSRHSIPVIMVSNMTGAGAQITLDCLALGALDFVLKPSGTPEGRSVTDYAQDLVSKVLAAGLAGRSKMTKPAIRASEPSTTRKASSWNTAFDQQAERLHRPLDHEQPAVMTQAILAVGASTGGPNAVAKILQNLHGRLPPIVISIHMPMPFTLFYANRLGQTVKGMKVKLAEPDELLCAGTAYITPGDRHLQVVRKTSDKAYVRLSKPSNTELYKPSIDKLFSSVALAFGDRALACVLTGMGSDGAIGAEAIYRSGGYVLSQDQESCAIYGMPKVVFENGYSHRQVSLRDIPLEIIHALNQRFTS